MNTPSEHDPWKQLRKKFLTCPVCTDPNDIMNNAIPGTPEADARGCICTVQDDGRFMTGVLTSSCRVHGSRVRSSERTHRLRESAPDLLFIVNDLLGLHAEMEQMKVAEIRKTIEILAMTANEVCAWIDDANEEYTTVRIFLGSSRPDRAETPEATAHQENPTKPEPPNSK